MKKIVGRILGRRLRSQIKNFQILATAFGQYKSIRKKVPIFADGTKIPWYTYPALEYLNGVDFSDKTVFEWGSGYSTGYWGRRSKEVISVEDDVKWYEEVLKTALPNNLILKKTDEESYVNSIDRSGQKFNVIIIDGKFRTECAKIATDYLADSGMIILDNSDWYSKSAGVLRNKELIQVDFHGFGPINGYTWTTSVFFSRKFNFKPSKERQPQIGIGAINQSAEK